MRDTIAMSFASIGSDLLQTVRMAEPMLHEVGNADATFRQTSGAKRKSSRT